MLQKNVAKYGIPLIYVNHVSSQTELIFDGGSMLIDASQKIIQELPYFAEELRMLDLDERDKVNVQPRKTEIEKIHDALVMGIKDYFQKSGFTKAVLGLSGGIDSAVVCALAVRALGNQNVM